MTELKNIAGYPVISKRVEDKTAVLFYINETQEFMLLIIGGTTNINAEISRYIKRRGFLAPGSIPTFSPPFRSAAVTVTGQCNMDCPYCFVYPVPNKTDMSGEFARTAIKALAPYMSEDRKQIYLWGGEPTQNPAGLFAALNAISDIWTSGECTATLTTNGYIESEILERLVRYDNLEFQISFDGKAHNAQKKIEGGSYDQALRSAAFVKSSGKNPILRITVTNQNIAGLKDTFCQIIENNLSDRICVEPVHAYVGRSRTQQDWQPNAELYASVLMDCIDYAEKNGCVVYSQPLRPLTAGRAYDWGFINILPDGTAVSTVAIVDASHPDTNIFLSGHIDDRNGELTLSDNLAGQRRRFADLAALKCVRCPVFSICKGNEQRDCFVSGTPIAEYRCSVFCELIRLWMERMLDKILADNLPDGEYIYKIARAPDQTRNILNISLRTGSII